MSIPHHRRNPRPPRNTYNRESAYGLSLYLGSGSIMLEFYIKLEDLNNRIGAPLRGVVARSFDVEKYFNRLPPMLEIRYANLIFRPNGTYIFPLLRRMSLRLDELT